MMTRMLALTATVARTTHDRMSPGAGDVYRLPRQGVHDVAITAADYAVADAPELEGLDLPPLETDAVAARALVADFYQDRFDSHALAIAPNA